ncbi:hypothetical protein ABBQ38_012484 [Trebouxia sp. C0009 RCD-2024]
MEPKLPRPGGLVRAADKANGADTALRLALGALAVGGGSLLFRRFQQSRKRHSDVEQALRAANAHKDAVHAEKLVLEKVLEEAQGQLAAAQAAEEEGKRQAVDAQDKHAQQAQQLQADVDRLQQQLQGLESELRAKDTVIRRLHDQELMLTDRVTSLGGQVGGLQQQLTDSSAEVVRLDADLHAATNTHGQAVQLSNASIRGHLLDAQALEVEMQELREQHQTAAAAAAVQVELLQQRVAEMDGALASLRGQLANAELTSTSETLQIHQLHGDVVRLQEQLQSMQGEVRGKETLMQGLQDGQGSLTGQVTDLSGQVDSLHQQLADSSAEVVRLTTHLTTTEEAHALALQDRDVEIKKLKERVVQQAAAALQDQEAYSRAVLDNMELRREAQTLKSRLVLVELNIKAAPGSSPPGATTPAQHPPHQVASAPAAGAALQLVAVPTRTQQQPQMLHGARAPTPAQLWFGLRLPMLWQQQAGTVVLLLGSRRVVSSNATQGWWLIVEVVRLSHVTQAGPLVCLVCVMHVAMLHITPHGVRSVHLVMWRVGMTTPVPCPHSQAVGAEPVGYLLPAHMTGCLGLGMPPRPLLVTQGAECAIVNVAARSNGIGLDMRALLRCMASSTGLPLCLPLCAAPPQGLHVEPAVTAPQLTPLAPAQASANGWHLPNRQQLGPASAAATGSGTPAAAAPLVAAVEDKSGSPAKRHAISTPPTYAIPGPTPSPVPIPPPAVAPPAAVIELGLDPKQQTGFKPPAHDGMAILDAILGRTCHVSPVVATPRKAILTIPPPPAAVIELGSDPKQQTGFKPPAHDGMAILDAILGRACQVPPPAATLPHGGKAILTMPPPPAVNAAGSAPKQQTVPKPSANGGLAFLDAVLGQAPNPVHPPRPARHLPRLEPVGPSYTPWGATLTLHVLPFWQDPWDPLTQCSMKLTASRLQEVVTHLQTAVKPLPPPCSHNEEMLHTLGLQPAYKGVPPDQVALHNDFLASGSSGTVTRARLRLGAQPYDCVIKILRVVPGISAEEAKAQAEREFNFLQRAWAGGVQQAVEPLGLYHEDVTEDSTSYLLMRLADGLDGKALAKALHKALPDGRTLVPEQIEFVVLHFAKSMLQGLMQLDKLDIAASDVKLENAVVDVGKLAGGQGPLLKLIDFGEATAAAGSADGGTPHNMPLEQLDPFRGCNAWGDPVAEVPHHQGLADIYCAGMALWSLIVGEMPLHRTIVRRGQDKRHDQYLNCAHLLKHELEQHLLRSGRQTGVECTLERDFAPYSPALLELVTCMLQHKTQRKSAEELLQLPVLAQLSDL